MTSKSSAVFWIGLLLILVNFWVSGQSTTFWSLITGTSTRTGGNPGAKPLPFKVHPPTHLGGGKAV